MVKIRIKTGFLGVCVIIVFLITALSAAAQLSINEIDFNSPGKANEVKPAESAEIAFEIENEGEDKVENIKTTIYFERNGKKLQDDEGDDIELEPDTIDYIRGGKSDDIKVSFATPFDVEDDEEYTIVIEVEGKNASNKVKLTDTDSSESFRVIRERHEMLFYKLDISPTTVLCGGTLNVHYDVRDIGEQDERGNLTIVNGALGMNFSENYDLDSDYDEDNKLETTKAFQLRQDIAPGVYPLTLGLYYDNNLKTLYNTTQITVECGTSAGTGTGTTTTTPAATTGQTGTAGTTGTGQQPNVDVQYNTQPAQPSTTYYSAQPPVKKEGLSQTTILIAAGIIVLVMFAVIIALVVGRRH